VDVVRKRHWLDRFVANFCVLWRRVIPGRRAQSTDRNTAYIPKYLDEFLDDFSNLVAPKDLVGLTFTDAYSRLTDAAKKAKQDVASRDTPSSGYFSEFGLKDQAAISAATANVEKSVSNTIANLSAAAANVRQLYESVAPVQDLRADVAACRVTTDTDASLGASLVPLWVMSLCSLAWCEKADYDELTSVVKVSCKTAQ